MNIRTRRMIAAATLAGIGLLGCATGVLADVLIKVGYGPGGNQDVYARVAARHLARLLPDSPEVEVVNVPGAGGRKLLKLAQTAPETNGSVIYVLTFSTTASEAIELAEAGIEVPAPRFIGSLFNQEDYCWAKHDSAFGRIEDMLQGDVKFGATGKGSSTYRLPAALRAILGAPFQIVTGFNGAAETFAALERGEVDLVCGATPVVATPFRRVAEVFRKETADPASDVPAICSEVAGIGPDDLAIMEVLEHQSSITGAMFLTEDTPDQVIDQYRAAFNALVADPAFLADLAATGLTLHATTGEALDATYAGFAGMDPETRRRLLDLTR